MRRNSYTYKENKTNTFPSRISAKILIYGFYAVLCQLLIMLLKLSVLLTEYEPSIIYNFILPEFEYPLINIALIISGAYLIDALMIRYS